MCEGSRTGWEGRWLLCLDSVCNDFLMIYFIFITALSGLSIAAGAGRAGLGTSELGQGQQPWGWGAVCCQDKNPAAAFLGCGMFFTAPR